jgi:hypothetical protein
VTTFHGTIDPYPIGEELIAHVESELEAGGYPAHFHLRCLVATIRDLEKRVGLARSASDEAVALAERELSREIDRRLEAERNFKEMRRERDEAIAAVPRLRDEIKSLHRELEVRR